MDLLSIRHKNLFWTYTIQYYMQSCFIQVYSMNSIDIAFSVRKGTLQRTLQTVLGLERFFWTLVAFQEEEGGSSGVRMLSDKPWALFFLKKNSKAEQQDYISILCRTRFFPNTLLQVTADAILLWTAGFPARWPQRRKISNIRSKLRQVKKESTRALAYIRYIYLYWQEAYLLLFTVCFVMAAVEHLLVDQYCTTTHCAYCTVTNFEPSWLAIDP